MNQTFFNSLSENDLGPHKLDWLIKIRFMVLGVQYPLALFGLHFEYLNSSSILAFIGLNTAFLLYNLWLRQNQLHRSLVRQIMLDVLVFTILLSLSGGPSNPFYVFFHFFAVLGGMFAFNKRSHLFLLFLLTCILWTHLYFNFHVYNFRPNIHLLINLFIQLLVCNIIFTLSRYLGFHLRLHQERGIQLTLQNAKLDRLRALGSLSAGFSHEFSSPLNTIKIRLKRLQRKLLESELLEDIEEAQLAAVECETVLRKMNASQFDHRALEFTTISLGKQLGEIIANWQEGHPRSQVVFEPQEKDLLIKAPLINFAQAILNLLDNALEASGEEAQIRVGLKKEETFTVLTISDKGAGFSSEVLEHLGEPFNTSKPTGTGLGLYTVMLFMDSVLGRCEVKNGPTQGAMIKLYFPRIIEKS